MKEFVKAFLKAQSQMGHAKLDSRNPHFKSEYASLESVLDAVKPALNANGLILIEKVCSLDGKLFVNTQIIHESGEFIESMTPIITERAGPQALGSGISYARRYSLEALCAIGSADDDGECAEKPRAQGFQPQAKSAEKPKRQSLVPGSDLVNMKNAGEYVMKFGKSKGQTLSQMGVANVSGMIGFIKNKADAKFKDSYQAKEFLFFADQFLKQPGNSPDENLDAALQGNKPTTGDLKPSDDWASEPMPDWNDK
jgi:hypothetical protein